jgi:membrane protease YdiL (CAAX protease family)
MTSNLTAPVPIKNPGITVLGLVLAMFGTSAILEALPASAVASLPDYLLRESLVFVLLGALLLLIRYGERLPFSSIGWHTDRLGQVVLWGLVGLLGAFAVIVLCVLLAQQLHWKVGPQVKPMFDPPLWAVTISMLRAGITEEVFRNGYALERLWSLTGSRWVALVLTLVPFAIFHFHQGPAGILIAGSAGGVLSLIYLRRRSLPTVILAHFLVDFIPNVLLPLLGADL